MAAAPRRPVVIAAIALAITPVAVLLLLRVRLFSLQNGVDPFIYVGYQQDTHDLLDRYGWLYFPVRFGILWPAHLFTSVFGIVPGYFVLRYLLALLALGSLVSLGRSQGSRLSGWAAGLVCLTSPVFIAALMTVYADTVGIPCMIAGCTLLLRQGSRKVLSAFGAGIFFALAFHSNFFVVLPLAGAFGMRALLQVARGRWRDLLDYVVVGSAVIAVTVVGALAYRILYGTFDILGPSIDAAREYSGAAGLSFRQNNLEWLGITPHLYIPPLVALALVAVVATRAPARGESRFERWARPGAGDALVMLLGVLLAYGVQQFVLDGYSVETYYYYSYTFPFTCVGLVMLFAELVSRGRRPVAIAAMVTAIGAPLVRNVGFQDLQISVLPWVPLVAVLVTAGALTTRWAPRVAVAVSVLVTASVGALAFASPVEVPVKPGMSARVEPRYQTMLGNYNLESLRIYEAAAELVDIVPKWKDDPGSTVYWYDSDSNLLNAAQATAYWRTAALQELGPGDPKLTEAEAEALRVRTPRHLVILSESAADLNRRVARVEKVIAPLSVADDVVGSTELPLHVAVMTFTASSCDRDWRGRSPWLELPPCP